MALKKSDVKRLAKATGIDYFPARLFLSYRGAPA